MNNQAKKPTLTEQAEQMARDGYGYEDIHVRLRIGKLAARYFVFVEPKKKAGAA